MRKRYHLLLHVPVCGPGGAYKRSTVVVDERAIIVQLQWVLWNQRARSRSTRYLQISRWQFGGDSSIILKFIALRVEARGMVRLFCRQPSILLYWMLPTIAKLGKMPL